ncbi:hypothetical protein TNCV_1293721 [Trichonephila clavipes]|nr:hypothetical protein TNCV_1293721 [Trichonephila clavipes]
MAGLWPNIGFQVMLGSPAMRTDQKVKQGAESSQSNVQLALKRGKSKITAYIGKCTATTQKNQESWKVMRNPDHCGFYPELSGES